jgi:FkbM family methyltransferase
MVAKIVGCENVHIFEPSAEYWPNIKRLWDINGFESVGGCFDGLVSDNNTNEPFYFGWPETDGEIFYDTHHSVEASKEISIDNYCELNNIYPDVIMMDVEGSELSIVRGALETMINHSPIFFISVHSDELMARSGGTKEDLFKLFREHGYSMMHINTDHEEHWKFYKE